MVFQRNTGENKVLQKIDIAEAGAHQHMVTSQKVVPVRVILGSSRELLEYEDRLNWKTVFQCR